MNDLLDELHAFFMGLLVGHDDLRSAAIIEFDRLRAALDATEPEPLDVGRLAQAIENHGDICSRMAIPECASAIAAAYIASGSA